MYLDVAKISQSNVLVSLAVFSVFFLDNIPCSFELIPPQPHQQYIERETPSEDLKSSFVVCSFHTDWILRFAWIDSSNNG